jgi:hypothetical protein
MSLGDFGGAPTRHGRKLDEKSGLLHRFGMDDASTGSLLKDLFAAGPLPDLTVAYFADNDYRSHKAGPNAALTVVERVDRLLGDAFDAAGGIERVLAETCVVVTSDHGHCDVLADADRAAIRLDRLLGNFRQAQLGGRWQARDEIMICPNMRAAQIYLRKPGADMVQAIAREALQDPRVDQVLWRSRLTRPDAEGYTVLTGRGALAFARRTAGEGTRADAFGGHWTCDGDGEAVDLQMEGDTVAFGQYPNAFERIAGVLDLDQSGELWVTARPGCEFQVPGGEAHVGGASHGALHALDSLSPVIVAGGPVRPRLPHDLRCVDIAPLCMQLLGLTMRYAPGAPRGAADRTPASPRRRA